MAQANIDPTSILPREICRRERRAVRGRERSAMIKTRTARLNLPIATKPYWVRLVTGVALGYRRNDSAGTWSVRVTGNGGQCIKRIALADDFEKAAPPAILTYSQAVRAAMDIGRPRAVPTTLEQWIANKFAAFSPTNEPACYLYRHYDPAGDLIYVGIALSPLRRNEKHIARRRYQILRILIEPFASREEALEAEKRAIRDEFPKFNDRHNQRRHPAIELRKIDIDAASVAREAE